MQENIGGSGRKNAIPGLAHIFKDTLPASALLLTGPAGSGKTMYCMQLIRDGIAAGERCAYVSLDPLFAKEKFARFVGEKAQFVAPAVKRSSSAESLLEEIGGAITGTNRVAVDSLTHLLPYLAEGEVIRFVAALYATIKEAGAMAVLTLTTTPSKELSDTLASLLDGTLQLKLEDEGDELARSIRLLSIRGMYHSPSWVRLGIREDGRLTFGHEEAEPACKLCDKLVTGKAVFDAGAAFHPHCLETYRKLSDIYGQSVIYTIPAGVVNANFFFIDIVGLSDPSLSVEKQIKKIEVLNRLIGSCDAISRTQKDRRIILPTGDGMAIGFLVNPELPLQLSMQLHRKLDAFNKAAARGEAIRVRIGLNSGPVFVVSDVNNNQNVWGPGIILARRVMDVGDEGHILVAGNLAEELINLKDEYRAAIKLVSKSFSIKHGQEIKVYSAFSRDFGNPEVPARLSRAP